MASYATMVTLLLAVSAVTLAQDTVSDLHPQALISFEPDNLRQMVDGEMFLVVWTTSIEGVASVRFNITDEKIVTVLDQSEVMIVSDDTNSTVSGTFNVSADFLGSSTITLYLLDRDGEVLASEDLQASVLLTYQNLVNILSTSLGILVGVVNVIIGATIDLELIKGIVKKPVGPLVGLFSQYLFMPVVAFGLSQTVFSGYPVFQLGIFLAGCSPGGGASNMWTHLLGGNLDMSIIMTFISTIVAFGALPAWVLLLGPIIAKDAAFVIPFANIAMLLITLIGPCFVGIFLQRFVPKVAKILKMLMSPVMIFVLLYTVVFGCIAYRYIFSVMDAKIIAGSFALPVIGYLVGLSLGSIFKQRRGDVIAISIETGLQNNSIALFMLNVTLQPPDSTLAIVVPATVFLVTPVPLMVLGVVRLVYLYVQRRKSGKEEVSMEGVDAQKNGKLPAIGAPKKPDPMTSHAPKPQRQGIDNPAADLSDEAH
ncbi:Bile acid:sodium symporter/arsenical resistance protein Acr3 [Trinorchestia longiramus]|nr:Bile acid:sodium symporter/arsenical resistance protein Acr3 [Trinorchestia longiramus]